MAILDTELGDHEVLDGLHGKVRQNVARVAEVESLKLTIKYVIQPLKVRVPPFDFPFGVGFQKLYFNYEEMRLYFNLLLAVEAFECDDNLFVALLDEKLFRLQNFGRWLRLLSDIVHLLLIIVLVI